MQTTANYGLKKPEGNDTVDIDVINGNMDMIDGELKKRILLSDIPNSLPANGGNADTVDNLHSNDFLRPFSGGKVYTGSVGGDTDLGWKKLFRMTGKDRSGNGTDTSSANFYDAGTIRGCIYNRNGNYSQGEIMEYPFQFTLYAWGGTKRGNSVGLCIPDGMPDIIRVVTYGINDFELQIRAHINWNVISFQFYDCGSGDLSAFYYENLVADDGKGTVVKTVTNHNPLTDSWNAAAINGFSASGIASTNEKSNIIGMVNELFQSASSGKVSIATAAGSPSLSSETFSQLATDITNGKNNIYNAISAKGTTPASKNFSDLVSAIGNISTGKKTATGTVISKPQTKMFSYMRNFVSTDNPFQSPSYYIVIPKTSINFVPSIILIKYEPPSYPFGAFLYNIWRKTWYEGDSNSFVATNGNTYIPQYVTLENNNIVYCKSQTTSSGALNNESTEFTDRYELPVSIQQVAYTWIAYE